MKSADFDVEEAGTDSDLGQLAGVTHPDVILLDVQPLSEALRICRVLRKDPRTARTPIIQITPEDYTAPLTAGPGRALDVRLNEPLDPDVLIATARRFSRAASGLRKLRALHRIRARPAEAVMAAGHTMGHMPTTLESRQRPDRMLAAVLESSPSLLVILDADGVVTHASRSAQEILGIAAEHLVGATLTARIASHGFQTTGGYPPIAEECAALVDSILSGLAVRNRECRARRPDGRGFTVLFDAVPLHAAGSAAGGLVAGRDITRRVQAENELAESRNQLESILDTMIQGVGLIAPGGGILRLNASARQLFGIANQESVPENLDDLSQKIELRWADGREIGSDELPVYRSLKGEEIPYLELQARFRDTGEVRIIGYRSAPVRGPNGAITHAVINVEDITAGKEAESALARSEERLRVTLESASLGTWKYSPETRLFSPDDEAKLLHGLDNSSPADRDQMMKHIHPGDRAAILSFLDTNIAEGAIFAAEARCVHPGDETRWLAYRARYVADPVDGVPRWLGVVWDVTAEKEAEQSLRESELRFSMLAETVPDILLTSPGDLTCDYINRRASEYTGLPAAELLRNAGLDVIHPDDRGGFLEAVTKSWRSGAPMMHEFRARRADGVYRWHRIRFVPRQDAHSKVVKWFGACTDIDDLKRLGQELESNTAELERLNHRLIESNSDLQQFAGIVAHDLQSPLNALVLIGDELAHLIHAGNEQEAASCVQSMMKSVARMQTLIRNVLDYSRVEWGGPNSFTSVDCNEVLGRALESLAGDIRATGSTVTSNRLPTVQGDPEQLGAVFQNLISNAIKYRKPGSAAHVYVSVVKVDGEWLFAVRDDGIGIAPSDTRRIFRIFERLNRKTDAGGVGIGLAICQRVIERHGGRIWVESELGSGSTFCFTIPSSE